MTCARVGSARLLAAGASLLLCYGPGFAADYPARSMRYVVAFGPGGLNDVVGRVFCQSSAEGAGSRRASLDDIRKCLCSGYPRNTSSPPSPVKSTVAESLTSREIASIPRADAHAKGSA